MAHGSFDVGGIRFTQGHGVQLSFRGEMFVQKGFVSLYKLAFLLILSILC